jgi:hypothetical protein
MRYLKKLTLNNGTKKAIRLSINISYLILSGLIFIMFILIFFLPADTLLSLSPVCEWKLKYGTECFFCGMTKAFIQISKLNFSGAINLNASSILLFGLLIANEIFAAFTFRGSINRIKNNYRIINADN